MDELEAIRQKKLAELQKQQQVQEQLQQIEAIVKRAFTKDALQRYGNVKAAFPDRATQVVVLLAQAIQAGQVEKVDDAMLKELLKKLTPAKKDFKINK